MSTTLIDNKIQVPSTDTVRAGKFKSLLQANNISPMGLANAAQVGEEYVFEALRGEAQMPYFWTRCFACLGVTPEQAKSQFGIVWDKHAIPEGGLPLLVKAQPEEKKRKKSWTHPDRADRLKKLMDSQKVRGFVMAKALGFDRKHIDEARSAGVGTPERWALMLTYLGVTKAQAQEWGIPWADPIVLPPCLPKLPNCRCVIEPPQAVPAAPEPLIQPNGKDHPALSLATEDRNKVTAALERLFDAWDLVNSSGSPDKAKLWRRLIETVEAV